ncbi:MAG: hypothetical protein J6U89_00165, partial [Bacteroidaceae bacterium]|nr:hypothetical protein [Bacteroidaceae bacterium]
MPGVFATICGQKVERERLQIEYTTKEIRLKTTEQNKSEPRFLQQGRNDKTSFVIGEFISGWSHEAWMKIMPCGSLKNERANEQQRGYTGRR